MADLKFLAQIEEQALVAATKKTLICVTAPTNQRVKILGWGVYFDGTNVSILATPADTSTKQAVDCVLAGGTVAGTFTSTLGALDSYGSSTIINGSSGSIQTLAETTVTVEPTVLNVFDCVEVNPANGGYEIMFKEGMEPIVEGGAYASIYCTAQDNVNVRAKIFCEE